MERSLTSIPETVQRDLEHATTILKAGGCRAVFLFGSAAAVRGCPPPHFFHLLGRLLADLDHPVDLVNLDVPGPFVEFLLTNGKLVQLG